MTDLLSCPFCGEYPVVAEASLWCPNRNCWGPEVRQFAHIEDAVAAWNRRTSPGGSREVGALIAWMNLWDRVCNAADPDDAMEPPPWSEVRKVIAPDGDPEGFIDADYFRDYMHASLVYKVRDLLHALSPSSSAVPPPASAVRDGVVVEALQEAEELLALTEHPALPDPHYHERVKALGREIGFGALMSTASAAWREVLAEDGYPPGSEFVAGPCFGSVQRTLGIVRRALSTQEQGR